MKEFSVVVSETEEGGQRRELLHSCDVPQSEAFESEVSTGMAERAHRGEVEAIWWRF